MAPGSDLEKFWRVFECMEARMGREAAARRVLEIIAEEEERERQERRSRLRLVHSVD